MVLCHDKKRIATVKSVCYSLFLLLSSTLYLRITSYLIVNFYLLRKAELDEIQLFFQNCNKRNRMILGINRGHCKMFSVRDLKNPFV